VDLRWTWSTGPWWTDRRGTRSGPLMPDPTAEVMYERHATVISRHAAADGGAWPEHHQSSPDLKRPATVWDAAEPYA
jgi:hypothetical protein